MVHSTVSPISDEQLRANTGKGWQEWVTLLETWDADKKTFASVANYLMRHYGLSRLYAQMIAVYFVWGRMAVT
jgi:hypothetical protein